VTWPEYHESTKHSPQALRRSQHTLDWANMPDPFRHYEGAPVLDLPADPPALEAPAANGPELVSQLLFHSAAISATKLVPSTGYRYALRVNPSSGNLHPTEFHFFTKGLPEWPDGFYHYRPSSHMAEQRALGVFTLSVAPIVFVLTSIAWREEWKYRDRAYRYCLHDIGHAWQALAMAAGAMGWDSFATGRFQDDEVARQCRLSPDEWPMLIVGLYGGSASSSESAAVESEAVWFGGTPNRLSDQTIPYPSIDRIHAATKLRYDGGISNAPGGSASLKLPAAFGEIARRRRSALDFQGGSRSMSLVQLRAILAAATQPFFADFAGTQLVQLYLYVHRVEGLDPGVYRHWAERGELELIRSGDQRVAAAGLSLGQDLAGNACVAFSMIGDLDRATRAHGDRGYRYAHFEAGAIGHRLYLAAEAQGLGATGIGAFFDDDVHGYLNLEGGYRQVIYHFAIGYPVLDSRLDASE
jgi:SagB-type dehydrogenase family enzyme